MSDEQEIPENGAEDELGKGSGHPPVERLWDDDAFRQRVREVAALRGIAMRTVISGAGTSAKYMQPSTGRNTNIVMRVAKVLDCHPAYLLFGPTVVTGPQAAAGTAMTTTNHDAAITRAANAEQRLAVIAQVVAGHWLNVALDPAGAARVADNDLRQIALLAGNNGSL